MDPLNTLTIHDKGSQSPYLGLKYIQNLKILQALSRDTFIYTHFLQNNYLQPPSSSKSQRSVTHYHSEHIAARPDSYPFESIFRFTKL